MSIWHSESGIVEPPDRRDGPAERRTAPRGTDRRRYVKQPKAACPVCRHPHSLVMSDWKHRPFYDESIGEYVRYRRCDRCQAIFSTGERVTGIA